MIILVLGYADKNGKGTPVLLYAGNSKQAGREAMKAGGEGIACAHLHVNPMVHQRKRFGGGSFGVSHIEKRAEKPKGKGKGKGKADPAGDPAPSGDPAGESTPAGETATAGDPAGDPAPSGDPAGESTPAGETATAGDPAGDPVPSGDPAGESGKLKLPDKPGK